MTRLLVVAVFAAGCARTVDLELPSFFGGDALRTAALLSVPSVEGPGGAQGVVIDASGAQHLAGASEELDVVLAYRSTLDALAWQAGPIAHDTTGSSRLRRPDAVFRREGDGYRDVTEEARAWGAILEHRAQWPEDRCGGPTTCFGDDGLCGPCEVQPEVAPPAPPRPWPRRACAPGFVATATTVAGDAIELCDREALRCGDGERADLIAGCVALGRPCTADTDGYPPAPDGAVYVSVRGGPAGVGTRASPWDLDTAVSASPRGSTLVLDAGAHAIATATVVRRFVIQGVCPSSTSITMDVAVGATTLRDLRVTASSLRFVSTAELTDVEIRGTGLYVSDGATVALTRSVVVDSGLFTRGSARVVASELRGAEGVELDGEATLALEGSVIGTSIETADTGAASSLRVRGSLFDPTRSEGTSVAILGSAIVEGSLFLASNTGVEVLAAASATITHSRFEGHAAAAIHAKGAVSLEAVTFSGGKSAIVVGPGGTVRAAQIALSSMKGPDIDARSEGDVSVTLVLEDLRIEDRVSTHRAADRAIDLLGGELTLRRARIHVVRDSDRAGFAGVRMLTHAEHSPLVASISDLSVRGTAGAAIESQSDAHPVQIEIRRVELLEILGTGIAHDRGGGQVELSDVLVRGVSASRELQSPCPTSELDLCGGTGIVLRSFPTSELLVTLERFRVEQAAYAGLGLGAHSTFVIRDGRVDGALIGVAHDPRQDWRSAVIDVNLVADALSLAGAF